MSLKEIKDGVILTIFVKPNAPKFKIMLDKGEIVVQSTEEPLKGKVNKQILKEFSKLFNCEVEIISGLTSRQKMLLAKDVEKAQAEKILKDKLVFY